MPVNKEAYLSIHKELIDRSVTLIAVSKTKPPEDINELYQLGQRDFGENYVQELIEKFEQLPKDIQWHFIGHLQSNKVKYLAPFVYMIQGVDSLKLLEEINKQALKNNRVINCLLQIHISTEETKFGLDEQELSHIITNSLPALTGVNVLGLMGMASFTDDENQITKEFRFLHSLYIKYPSFNILSMGMSSDYNVAVTEGSTMVRMGSLLFGKR